MAFKKISIHKNRPSLFNTFLKEHPDLGTPLGNNCYKIRMAISSKNKGKSGGARVITYVKIIDEVVFLLSIYDKSDTDTIEDHELLSRIKDL